MKYNIREIEELKEELEEVNKKLIELSKCNMIGVELNHKKFGKGKIISQNDFNIAIQFEKEQKQLKFPFIFVNGIVECSDNNVLEKMKEINTIQVKMENIQKEIKNKKNELNTLNLINDNKDEKPNLFAVTTGISYDYILETKIYCCKANRCKKICEYLGLYADKSIVKIAKIRKIIEAEKINGKLETTLIFGDKICDEDIKNIELYIKKGYELFGGDIGTEKHKYFIVDKFYNTDYKKISPNGIMEHKYFDLYKRLKIDKMPSIEELAEKLKDIEWK